MNGQLGIITCAESGDAAECWNIVLTHRTLSLETRRAFELRKPVKVESENRLWAGEVIACEDFAEGFKVEVAANLVLNDLASLNEIAARFRQRS